MTVVAGCFSIYETKFLRSLGYCWFGFPLCIRLRNFTHCHRPSFMFYIKAYFIFSRLAFLVILRGVLVIITEGVFLLP
jgi:hypothetical protein